MLLLRALYAGDALHYNRSNGSPLMIVFIIFCWRRHIGDIMYVGTFETRIVLGHANLTSLAYTRTYVCSYCYYYRSN